MKKLVLVLVLVLSLSTSFAQMFAHVDSQKVLDTMPSRMMAMKEISDFETRAMKEMQDEQAKFNKEYTEFETSSSTMSPTARRFEEERLSKKYQELQTRGQELDQQMNILANDLNAPILDRVKTAIENVAKAEKLDYVLDQSGLLYAKGKDITDKVIAEVLKLEAAAAN
ncbi:MAG: OmpH family outer membrane protein [Crocinitomicaceae bacterium]|nr:OmpH family outer membrane protein [Crocinitomicaceae bacterium]